MNTVFSMEMRARTINRTAEDAFVYTPKAGWKWLQRLCFRVLAKLGCYQSITETSVKTYRIDDGVVDKIMRMATGASRVLGYDRPKDVFVGRDELAEILGDPNLPRQPFDFVRERRYGDHRGVYVYGIRIHVIPWMRGAVLVPPEFTLHRSR